MDYILIRAWGRFNESPQWFVRDQIKTAHEDKAPGNAIYKSDTGVWATIDDVKSSITRTQVERMAAAIQRSHNPGHPDTPPRHVN